MKKLIIVAAGVWLSLFAALALRCAATPVVVRESDTSAQQEELLRVQEKLEKVPDSAENRIVPRDRAVIYQAGDALTSCRTSLFKQDKDINVCEAHLREFDTLTKSLKADLKKCESETGFLSSVSSFFSKVGLFFVGLGSGAVLTICGIIAMHVTGALGGMLARIPRP